MTIRQLATGYGGIFLPAYNGVQIQQHDAMAMRWREESLARSKPGDTTPRLALFTAAPTNHRLINRLINLIKHYEKVLFILRFLGPTCEFKGIRREYKHGYIVETTRPYLYIGIRVDAREPRRDTHYTRAPALRQRRRRCGGSPWCA